jgi:hypothetical protein
MYNNSRTHQEMDMSLNHYGIARTLKKAFENEFESNYVVF